MILINIQDLFTNIFLTLDNRGYSPLLHLINDAEQKQYTLPLGENISANKDRYDQFRMSRDLFINMPTGFYCYSIKDLNEDTIESGKMYITPAPTDNLSIFPGEQTDIIIVN